MKHVINQLHNRAAENDLKQGLANILAVVVRGQPFQEPLLGIESLSFQYVKETLAFQVGVVDPQPD